MWAPGRGRGDPDASLLQKDPDGQQWVMPVDPDLRLTSFLTDSERGHSPGVPAASCVCRGRFLP